MKKTFAILFVAAAVLGGCAAHASPAARATAVRLYAEGASCDEVGAKMGVDREHARELIRTGIADLSKKFFQHP